MWGFLSAHVRRLEGKIERQRKVIRNFEVQLSVTEGHLHRMTNNYSNMREERDALLAIVLKLGGKAPRPKKEKTP